MKFGFFGRFASRAVPSSGRWLLLAGISSASALAGGPAFAQAPATPPPGADTAYVAPTALTTTDTNKGTGITPARLDTVRIFVHAFRVNGAPADGGREPSEFRLASDSVAPPGLVEGVLGMKTSGRRKIAVPASLGYGARGKAPSVPANAALEYEVELLDVVPDPRRLYWVTAAVALLLGAWVIAMRKKFPEAWKRDVAPVVAASPAMVASAPVDILAESTTAAASLEQPPKSDG
jgi:FKBP-type peptidyl-prolyl cis-trans isomerase FkpA